MPVDVEDKTGDEVIELLFYVRGVFLLSLVRVPKGEDFRVGYGPVGSKQQPEEVGVNKTVKEGCLELLSFHLRLYLDEACFRKGEEVVYELAQLALVEGWLRDIAVEICIVDGPGLPILIEIALVASEGANSSATNG